MRPRLQRNLVLLFVWSSAIPLVAVGAIGYFGSVRSVLLMVGERAASASDRTLGRFEQELDRRMDDFGAVVRDELLREPNGVVDAAYLLEQVGFDLLFSTVVALDREGRPLYKIDYRAGLVQSGGRVSHELQTSGFVPEDARGIEQAFRLAGEPVSVLSPDGGSGAPLRLVAPLHREGKFAGALAADVDVLNLAVAAGEFGASGKEAFHVLVDTRNGILLHHPDPTKRRQALARVAPELANLFRGGVPRGEARFRDAQGREWLLAYRRLPQTAWLSGVAVPLGIYLAPVHRTGQLSLLFVIGVIVVTAVVLHLATRRFRATMSTLTGAADALSKGRFEHRIGLSANDELGALAAAFDRLAVDLQQLIEEREHSARMESFSRLSAAVAHELKGSLFSLSLLLENFERHKEDPEFLRDSLTTVRAVSDRIKGISSKLSSRRSIEDRRVEPQDLTALLSRIVEASAAGDRPDTELVTEFAPGVRVEVDASEAERVFLCLLHNSAEAMPAGGQIHVASDLIDRDGARWARVVVRDAGLGMAPEFIEKKLFRPFATTKSGGVGLGLYTSKQIVESYGGRIEVSSHPGEGSVFSVYLPAVPGG